jgi:sulfatase maturation enzyme AslB (radical SAM superfamily)
MSRNIKVLHLEPTDVCQAACPLCARETDKNFRKDRQHHLSLQQVQKHFDDDAIVNLDKMFMCGNYGDPVAGKNTVELFQHFRKVNPNIVLGMNTNGAIQTSFWWYSVAKILNQPRDFVVFSIDGLEDTNSVYRKNVNWSKLIANARAFIEAGGSAHWDMLVYKHNQHQVDECEQLAKDMGFKWFRAKISKRGFSDRLEAPIGWLNPQVQGTTVNCHALNEQSAYIDAKGNLSPCCWLGARQKDFVTDFDAVQNSWNSIQPNIICLDVCGSKNTGTSFSNQWQREVEFHV